MATFSFSFLFFLLVVPSLAARGGEGGGGRPPPSDRKFVSPAIDAAISDIKNRMKDPILAAMFENCLPNTLDTTVCTLQLHLTAICCDSTLSCRRRFSLSH
jgi:hypothetical protein